VKLGWYLFADRTLAATRVSFVPSGFSEMRDSHAPFFTDGIGPRRTGARLTVASERTIPTRSSVCSRFIGRSGFTSQR